MLEGNFFDTPSGIFVGKAVKPARPVQSGVLQRLPCEFDADANLDVAVAGAEPGEQ